MKRKSLDRRRLRPWVFVLIAGVLLFLLRVPILVGFASFLVTEDYLNRADIIYLLNGSVDSRPFLASTLWKEGMAPIIVIASVRHSQTVELGLQPSITDISQGVLKKSGVPEESIEVLTDEVTSTREEALALRSYLEENKIEKVIVVTSAFHTRRSRWIIEKELSGLKVAVQMAASSEPFYDTSNWWKHEQGMLEVFEEYVKLLFYLIHY